MSKTRQNSIIITISLTAIVIAGSLVFLGIQIGKSGENNAISAFDIEEGIKNYIAKEQEQANQPQVVSGDYSDDDAFLGDKNAPVTIVEFSDYQCPYCRSFYNETLDQIKEKYIETGKAKLVYRDYPLSFHSGALPAALAAECAREQEGDEIYFAMHDKIFDRQNLLGNGTVDIPDEDLRKYAQELDLDMDTFDECIESEKFKEEIYADMADGQGAGISGTPGFVINGQRLSGAQPFSAFESIIEAELSK